MGSQEWLKKAQEEKWAIGAFNVGNLEVFKAIVQAAANKKSPIIIESSPGETTWMGAENIVDIARNFSQEYKIPILVNLDHAENFQQCLEGIEVGYNLIHFDGSKLPLDQNIEIAKKVVEAAHQKGIIVEGEMDHIVGSSNVHLGSAQDLINKEQMTDPERAAQFVRETGIDILAVFFGNVHGVFQEGGENLDLERLQKVAAATNSLLSLHGGSGIDDNQVQEAIKRGIVKVNINTEIRQIFKEGLKDILEENPDEYALYKIEGPVLEKVQKLVEHKMEVFGSMGKA